MAFPQSSHFYNMLEATSAQPGLIPVPEASNLLSRHGTFDFDRGTPLPGFTSLEPSPRLTAPFTPEPTWGLLEPDLSLKQALNSDYTRSTTSTKLTQRTKLLLIVSSLIPTLAATAQLLLLLYLLDVYVSLPQNPSGGWPRISPVYSIWPYIACVGSIRLVAYRTFGFLIAFFYVSTFILDMYVHWDVRPAKALRWARLLLSAVSGGALIAVVFVSADHTSHLHIYLVSAQGIAFALVKSLTWAVDHTLCRHYPRLRTDRTALFAKRLRYIVYVLALPVGFLTVIGIYACHNPEDIQRKGTTCYILSAISAICDWIYQLISVAFLLSLAYDLYQAEHYARVRARSEISESRESGFSGESQAPFARYQHV